MLSTDRHWKVPEPIRQRKLARRSLMAALVTFWLRQDMKRDALWRTSRIEAVCPEREFSRSKTARILKSQHLCVSRARVATQSQSRFAQLTRRSGNSQPCWPVRSAPQAGSSDECFAPAASLDEKMNSLATSSPRIVNTLSPVFWSRRRWATRRAWSSPTTRPS